MPLIREALVKQPPPYVRILRSLDLGGRLGPTASASLVAVGFFIALLVLSVKDPLLRNPWTLIDLPLLIFATLRLPAGGYYSVIREAEDLEELLTTSQQKETMRTSFLLMFRSKWQNILCISLGTVAVLCLISLRFTGGLPTAFQALDPMVFYIGQLFMFIGAYVGGWGVWLIVRMVVTVREFGECEPLNLNSIWPQSTLGLERFRKLIRQYALSFSVGLVVVGLPILFLNWAESSLPVRVLLVYLWPSLFFGLFFLLLLYPRVVFRRLIERKRQSTIRRMEHRIAEMMTGPLSGKDCEDIARLATLQQQISRARRPAFSFSAFVTWASSLGIQLPFLMQWLERLNVDWDTLLGWLL